MTIIQGITSYLEIVRAREQTEHEQGIRQSVRESLRHHYAFPKITSGAIAIVLASLLAFLDDQKGPSFYEILRAPLENRITKIELQALCRQARELRDELAQQGSVPTHDPDLSLGDDRALADLRSVGCRYDQETGYDAFSLDEVRIYFNRLFGSAGHRVALLSKQTSSSAERQAALNSARVRATQIEDKIKNIADGISVFRTEVRRRATLYVTIGLTIATGAVLLLFLWVWSREKSDERWLAFLLTEAGLTAIVRRLRAMSGSRNRISRTDFEELIAQKQLPRSLSFFLGPRVDHSLIPPISKLLLEKLKSRRHLRELGPHGLGDHFEFISQR